MDSTVARPEFLFTSERLGFRLPETADLDALKKLDMDPDVRAQFPEGTLTPEQIETRLANNAVSHEKNGFGDFAVIDLETGEFTGRAGFARIDSGEIEAGYVFLKDYWGRGLAQESLRALLAWAESNLDVPRIIAYAPTQHAASFNVMQKAGMTHFKSEQMRGVDCEFYEYRFRTD